MSSDFAHSTVSYTSISSNDPSWGIPAMDPYKEVAHQGQVSPPLSPKYVPGPEHPPSPNYVPDPEHPPSSDYSYGDDTDDEDEEEASEEEEKHLAPTNSFAIPIDDPVPSAEETEPFETNGSAPTPPSLRLRRARISVRPQTPMAATTKALIAAVATALPSSSPPDSPLTPLSSPLPQIPSPPLPLPAPSSPLLLPATDHREDVPEADLPLQKRLYLTAPASSFIDTMDATLGRPRSREVSYGIMDVWDDMVGDMKERAPTTLKDLS
ncbi:hypothetical protein Tco_1089677 [Tanacetum coccineum]